MRHLRRNNWSLNKGNNQKIIEDKSVCVCSFQQLLLTFIEDDESELITVIFCFCSSSRTFRSLGSWTTWWRWSPTLWVFSWSSLISKTTCELISENFLSCWSDLFCSPSAGSGVVFSYCCWKRFLRGCFRVKAYKWLMTGGFYCEAVIVN